MVLDCIDSLSLPLLLYFIDTPFREENNSIMRKLPDVTAALFKILSARLSKYPRAKAHIRDSIHMTTPATEKNHGLFKDF